MRAWTAIALSVALLGGGYLAGLLLTAACSENLRAGTRRESVCSTVAEGRVGFWLAVLWPVMVYAASWLIPGLRRRVGAVGLVIAALAMVFWARLLIVAG